MRNDTRQRQHARLALLLSIVAMPVLVVARDQSILPGWERFVAPVLGGAGTGAVYFPAEYSGDAPREVLDPQAHEVRLTRADDPGVESVHAAGEPFHPPAGRWRLWLQGEWNISPASALVVIPASRRPGMTPHMMPLVPGGRVGLPEDVAIQSDRDLWLLAAEERSASPRHELSRRRSLSEVGDGVLMPSGLVLAGVWDRRRERYVALSRPFHLPPESVASAPLERPDASGSWLVAFLEHRHPSEELTTGLEPTITLDGEEHRADFTMRTPWGVHAVWYGLAPGPALLSGGNDALYLEPQTLELEGGGIARFEGVLLDRPFLDVGLILPRLLRERPLALAVRQLPDGVELARVDLSRQAGRHRFDGLVHGVLEVVLETHLGPFRRQLEVTGEENFLTLAPELIEVFGTVHRSGEPHPATVTFDTVAGDPIEATTDGHGGYHATSLDSLRWVNVQLDGVDQQPWEDFFAPPIQTSRELDFDISVVEVAVRVVDGLSGEGIDGAVVSIRNEYRARESMTDGVGERGRGERAIARSHTADEEGLVHLPPPRPGLLEIHVEAEGYRPLQQPLMVEIDDPPQDQALEIPLEPLGETVQVRLLLAAGSPAAGAEAMRVTTLAAPQPLSLQRADADGVVRVPAEPAEGFLLLRHPQAAFGIVDWGSWKDEERVEWVFPPAAESALSVRVLDPSGEQPVPGAGVSLWVGDRQLSGMALHWLSGARPMADRNGFWSAHRLPAVPVRILAWDSRARQEAHVGAFDTLAIAVPYPWPPLVDLLAVR